MEHVTQETGHEPPLLSVRDLVARYESRRSWSGRRRFNPVIHGVSFEIHAGRTLGLVGESGSGKTTIGRAVLRLVEAHSGSIAFRGEEITKWGASTPLRYRRDVQVVFQDPLTSLNPRMLVGDTLTEAVRFHSDLDRKGAEQRVRELLDDVGLTPYHATRYPAELSGGQQQRVAIARALSPGPKLLVCDEPVSALDVSTQSQVINLLRDLQERHALSYLFISHDLSVVRHVSDTIAVLHRGELLEYGDAERVYRHPQQDYTRELLAAIPDMTAPFRDPRRSSPGAPS